MWQSLKSDFTEFVRAAGEEGGSAIATLDKKLNDLDDKLTEVTGGNRNEDDDSDDIDYTGGDANDVFVGQIDSNENVSPPDLTEISDAAMNVGKTAASFLAGVGEKVGGAATSIRMHQSMGRPPFVMAAVEDDDDEYVEGEVYNGQVDDEGEEEEELGWSESEEEEEEEGSDSGDEVDFTNESQSQLPLESLDVVKLRESLKNAEEERNQCMQLVEDRNQEICKLKVALDQRNNQSSFDSETDLRREVLWFKKLIAVTRQEESPAQLQSILSEMRDKGSNKHSVADLEMKIQSVKDSLATCYTKIDQSLLTREEVKQTALKERIGELEGIKYALHNEVKNNRDQIIQLELQQQELEEQSARETVELARPQNSPSSSTSSGGLL